MRKEIVIRNLRNLEVGKDGEEGFSATFSSGLLNFISSEKSSETEAIFQAIMGDEGNSRDSIILPEGIGKNDMIHLSQNSTALIFDNLPLSHNLFFLRKDSKGSFYIDGNKLEDMTRRTLMDFSIDWDLRMDVSKMSLASRQILELLQVYNSSKSIILIEEPSALLSFQELETAYRILRKMKDEGRIILISSTSMKEIADYSDTLTILSGGRAIFSGRFSDSINLDEIRAQLSKNCKPERYPKINGKRQRVIFSVQGLQALNILKDITFSLRQGEILGVTGLGGSGRSLLCRVLAGIQKKNDGKIMLYGTPVTKRASNAIAYIPSLKTESSIYDNLTIGENISIASLGRFRRKSKILSSSYMRMKTSEYVKKLNLNAERYPATLSSGIKQKILLSRYMMAGAKIYILDEPTAGMDTPSKIDYYNMIGDIKQKGGAIIFVSSDIEELLGMADRIMVISHGQIALDENANLLTKEALLKAVGY